MKKIFKYIVPVILLYASSCSDYLELDTLPVLTVENYYRTPEEAEIALNGVYNILSADQVQGFGNQSTYSRNLMIMLNGATDEAFARDANINPNYVDWGVANFTSQSNFVNESWVFFYAGINRANVLIDRVQSIEGFEGNRKNEIIAEARFLRGFYHMMLSMMHGGVPVYDGVNQDQKKPRNTIQQVYNLVLADYEYAHQTLTNTSNQLGRVNKLTAAGMLAKAHTYLASAKNSGLQGFISINSFDWVDANTHYTKALAYTQEIIDSGAYTLTQFYDRLFRETTNSEQYEETLFAAEASSNSTANVVNVVVNAFVPQGNFNTRGGGFGWYRPASELYFKYVDQDVRRNHNVTGNYNTANHEFVDGVKYFVPREIPNVNVWYMSIGKYRMVDPALKTLPNWASNLNLPILRFADILLLHAEAQYFLGNESDARNTLSIVRSRSVASGATLSDLTTAYQKADFVEELLDERSRELCFENWRRIDLARFNKFDDTINSLSTTTGFYNNRVAGTIQSNWASEKVWFPIPVIQMDLNENLIQNQSY